MKTLIIAALAASFAVSPVLAAPYDQRGNDHDRGRNEQHYRGNDHRDPRAQQYRPTPQIQYRNNWRKGERFESRYARNYQVIGNPRAYRLAPAPRGYRWVRSNNDAVLVGITTGIIASVLTNHLR